MAETKLRAKEQEEAEKLRLEEIKKRAEEKEEQRKAKEAKKQVIKISTFVLPRLFILV